MNAEFETSDERDCATSRQVLALGKEREEEADCSVGKPAKSGLRVGLGGGRDKRARIGSVGTLQREHSLPSLSDSAKANGSKWLVPSTALWRRSMSHQEESKGMEQEADENEEKSCGAPIETQFVAMMCDKSCQKDACEDNIPARVPQRAGWPVELEKSQPLKLWPLYEIPRSAIRITTNQVSQSLLKSSRLNSANATVRSNGAMPPPFPSPPSGNPSPPEAPCAVPPPPLSSSPPGVQSPDAVGISSALLRRRDVTWWGAGTRPNNNHTSPSPPKLGEEEQEPEGRGNQGDALELGESAKKEEQGGGSRGGGGERPAVKETLWLDLNKSDNHGRGAMEPPKTDACGSGVARLPPPKTGGGGLWSPVGGHPPQKARAHGESGGGSCLVVDSGVQMKQIVEGVWLDPRRAGVKRAALSPEKGAWGGVGGDIDKGGIGLEGTSGVGLRLVNGHGWDGGGLHSGSATGLKRSFRQNLISHSRGSRDNHRLESVKVLMDGMLFGRKLNLLPITDYETLIASVRGLFEPFLGASTMKLSGSSSTVTDNVTGTVEGPPEYILTYWDRDHDLLLVGDDPWEDFRSAVTALRVVYAGNALTQNGAVGAIGEGMDLE